MSEWWLPAGTAIAALVLTYLFCVRPMRRGHCASRRQSQNQGAEELDQALDLARKQLAELRAQAARHDSTARAEEPSTRDRHP